MGHTIKHKADAQAIATGLQSLGWTPTVGTVSLDGQVRGHRVGVIVKIGDERLQWGPHTRNPITDFFSIANIAMAQTKIMDQQPMGFAWSMAGVDQVEIHPDNNERLATFLDRLSAHTPQAQFDFTIPLAKIKASAARGKRP